MKRIIMILLFVILLAGCMTNNTPIANYQDVAVQLLKSTDIDIASAQCRVSADDMDTIAAYLTVTETTISGELSDVPFGEDRLFEILCYNSSEVLNYYGSTLADINSIAPVVNIILYPADSSANVTIIGTFGDTSSTEEKIVFVADWNGNYDTYIMDVDGTNIKQLTSSPYGDNCPELSPDRQKVVYQRPSEIGHQGFIVDVNTLEVEMLPLVEYSPHQLSWHPDGDKLIFWSIINGTADVFIYDLETDSVSCVIEDSARNWGPVYTPDGEQFIYYSDKTGPFRAYIANLDGSNQQILSSTNYVEERSPRLHPSNSNLLVFAGRGYDYESSSQFGLFILNRLTGNVQEVISTKWVDEARPNWLNDGDAVLYQHFDGGNYGLYTINADGTQNKPLLDTNGNERYPHCR